MYNSLSIFVTIVHDVAFYLYSHLLASNDYNSQTQRIVTMYVVSYAQYGLLSVDRSSGTKEALPFLHTETASEVFLFKSSLKSMTDALQFWFLWLRARSPEPLSRRMVPLPLLTLGRQTLGRQHSVICTSTSNVRLILPRLANHPSFDGSFFLLSFHGLTRTN